MSKYEVLWKYIKDKQKEELILSFEEIEQILGVPINHSFLNSKKELIEYGYKVVKIKLKDKKIIFIKLK